MRTSLSILCLTFALVLLPAARADLKHRYNFNADAKDSIGTANATLQGAATLAGGAVVLDGSDGTFVQLPAGLLAGYNAVTIEAWATFGANGNWPRLFDFGDTDASGAGQNYLFFTPHSGAGDTRLVISDADPGYNHEEIVSIPGVLDNAGKMQIAAVFDPSRHFLAFYTNGVLAAARSDTTIPITAITNALNYIGKSLYSPDAFLTGSIDEFRIYDNALNGAEIAASAASGPETPSTDPGALISIKLMIDSAMLLNGFQTPAVIANFAKATNIDLSGVAGLTFTSSKSTIVAVTTNGLLQAVGLGTASITVSYQGLQDTASVTVNLPKAVLKHRYSFNDTAGTTTIKDSAGTANATLKGGASLAGDGKVTLDGTDGYVDLPNGIISSLTNATFETWVTWTGTRTWERIFDFGNNSAGEDQQGTGQTYLFLTPRGASGVVRFAITTSSGGGENPVLNSPSILPNGQETYVAVTYNASGRQARLYVNGRLAASGTAVIPLKNIKDINNWLGRSNWPDPYFTGAINEFRVYEGVLTDTEIAYSAAAGPDVLGRDPGAFQSLKLQLPSTNLFFGGMTVSAALLADFQNVTNVNVTGFAGVQFQSSDTNVISVSTNGTIEPLALGTAMVSAQFQNKTASVTLSVTQAPGSNKAALIHRYSFNEAPGASTIADSVGTANGTLNGTGTFAGDGQLTLPGTDGYVDLPNGIISSLTNVTFETWVTSQSSRTWERIFDFGSNTGGEDNQGTGDTYLFLTPRGGSAVVRFAATVNSGGAETPVLNGTAALPRNQEAHVAVTYNISAGAARLFVNGKRVAIGPATLPLNQINDINNWLGRSQYRDPNFTGKFNEFRIYDGALTDAEVAADFAAGPDAFGQDLANRKLAAVLSGKNLVLNWPTQATGFVLEQSPAVGAKAAWTAVAAAPVINNNQNTVTVPVSGSTTFFRLRK